MDSQKVKEILENIHMKNPGFINGIISALCDYGLNEDEDGEEIVIDIPLLTQIMIDNAKYINQKSMEMNGFNGVYPISSFNYGYFEPEIRMEFFNLKSVTNNEGDGFNIGLYEKENKTEQAIVIGFLPYRNDSIKIMTYLIP